MCREHTANRSCTSQTCIQLFSVYDNIIQKTIMCHIPRGCKSHIIGSIGVCSFVTMDVPQWIVGVLIRHEGNGSSRYLVGICHLVDTRKERCVRSTF